MNYETENGVILTDDQLEKMAAEYESGEWEGHLENVVMGVPKADDADELTVVSFRLPKSRVAAIDATIANRGMSKSEFYRQAVDRELLALA
ncbi:MAG: ribbon-helix-helix protein, CopG family [Eggerthellaceae bacterium]|nr:ribbon-helix-helix protein, CopG family [Eggerthellaceae bacterium]